MYYNLMILFTVKRVTATTTTTTTTMMMMMMMILEGWRKEITWRKKLFTVSLSNCNKIQKNKHQIRSWVLCILNSVPVTEHRSQFIVFYMSGISKQHKVYSPDYLLAAFLCQHIHSFHAWGFLVVQYWAPVSQSVLLRWKRHNRALRPETRESNKGVEVYLSYVTPVNPWYRMFSEKLSPWMRVLLKKSLLAQLFLCNKKTRCTNFTNLFCHETLHVSDSSSAHHQEFIHCTLSNSIRHTGF